MQRDWQVERQWRAAKYEPFAGARRASVEVPVFAKRPGPRSGCLAPISPRRTVPILGAQHKCRLGEAWDILLHLAGRSLAAFGHAAGSVTDQPTTRSDSDEEFNAGQRA